MINYSFAHSDLGHQDISAHGEGEVSNLEARSADSGTWSNNTPSQHSYHAQWFDRQVRIATASGVFTITVELTPDLAAVLLAHNPANRKIGEKLVARYAADITQGRWEHNGETIIVADTGELNDGQHRCAAVIAADIPIVTQITFGVKRDTRVTLDTGKKRTVGQHLSMIGHHDTNNLAHAAIFVMMMENNNTITTSQDYRPNPSEVIEWVNAHPELYEDLPCVTPAARAFRVSRGLMAALRYRFNLISRADSDRFFESLASGANLSDRDPIFRLRKRLTENLAAPAKLPQREIAALVIKTWNYWRQGRQVQQLGRRRRGQGAEDFPIPE